jgi:hypothetical protein
MCILVINRCASEYLNRLFQIPAKDRFQQEIGD